MGRRMLKYFVVDEYLEAARIRSRQMGFVLELGARVPRSERVSEGDQRATDCCLAWTVRLDGIIPKRIFNLAIAYEKGNRLRGALQEITTSLHLAPEDPDERNTKAIIGAELGDLVCARDEWEHLVQGAPDYAHARVNLAILSGSHLPLPASTSTALNGRVCSLKRRGSRSCHFQPECL